MAEYTDEQLLEILRNNFIDNEDAFDIGRRNDDMVDSMCICFALNLDWWTNVWLPSHCRNTEDWDYFDKYLEDHYDRVANWLEGKEQQGYKRGEHDILRFCINY